MWMANFFWRNSLNCKYVFRFHPWWNLYITMYFLTEKHNSNTNSSPLNPGRRIPLWKIKPLSLDSLSPVRLTTWFISLYEANPCLPQDNVILRPLFLSSTSPSCLPADAHLLKSFQTQGCYSLGPHYNLISIPPKFQRNSRLLRHETDQHGTRRECLRRLGLQTSP